MKPVKVTDADLAFGGDMSDLLPSMSEIPENFKYENTEWNKIVADWFYYGLKNVKWYPKEGIDPKDAVSHVQAILGSYEPKHEHKVAGVAYLLSEFFEKIEYERAK